MRDWPEHLFIYHFKEVLDQDFRQACTYRAVLDHIQDWYRMAVAMDLEIHLHQKPTLEKPAKRAVGH